MKHRLFSAAVCIAVAMAAPAYAAPFGTTYAIDFDSTRISGSNTSGSIDTTPGFTSLDVTNGGNASVTIDGIDFEVFTTPTNNSRVRSGPNSLTRDFIFEDSANAAVGILIGGAGDLDAGQWQVEVWAWDSGESRARDFIVGSRRNGSETLHTTSFFGSPTDPFTFILDSDGVGAYDVFVRENSVNNRTRMNAIRLTAVPSPTAALAGLIGLAGLGMRRRRG